jgi:hypothetical protein
MTFNSNLENINLTAGADLRGAIYELVKIDATGRVVKTNAATDAAIGIISVAPDTQFDTTDRPVTVALLKGVGLVKSAGAITAGSLLVPSATVGAVSGVANLAALAADTRAVGVALTATSAAGQVFRALLMPSSAS